MGSLGGSKPSKPAPTAAERALAERGAREWNDYLARIAPREEEFLSRIRAKRGAVDGLQRLLQGEIGAETAGQEQDVIAAQAGAGVGPSSARSRAAPAPMPVPSAPG